jgi:hypothetical protein
VQISHAPSSVLVRCYPRNLSTLIVPPVPPPGVGLLDGCATAVNNSSYVNCWKRESRTWAWAGLSRLRSVEIVPYWHMRAAKSLVFVGPACTFICFYPGACRIAFYSADVRGVVLLLSEQR